MKKEIFLIFFIIILFIWYYTNIPLRADTFTASAAPAAFAADKKHSAAHIGFAPMVQQRVFSKKSGKIIEPDTYIQINT